MEYVKENLAGVEEIEVVEFKIGDNYFAINVSKVREIIPYLQVTKIPNSHPCIKGIFKIRDSVISAIDLPKYLNLPVIDTKDSFYIIAHFNGTSVGFEVHEVIGIHRLSPGSIEKPDESFYGAESGIASGIVKLEDKLVILLELEKILYDISPKMVKQVANI